jgi:predicted nucleic acid-binding protein
VIFYYLDASAWVKRYYQEPGTRWVQELFAQNPTIACASLGLIEVTATLARKRKAREIDPLSCEQKVRELEEDWRGFIQIQLTTETTDLAKDLARDMALRGADAVHLASALVLRRRFADAEDRLIFAASDRELKEAAQSSGLAVIDPEEQEKQATSPGAETQEEDTP